MGHPFHTSLCSTISPCSTKSYISRIIKHSTTVDAHSYEQASCKRKATLIISLVLLDDKQRGRDKLSRKKQHPDPTESEVNASYSLSSDGLLFFGSTRSKSIIFFTG